MKHTYPTKDGKTLSLKGLDTGDKAFLAKLMESYERGENYLSFKLLYTDPDCQAYRHAKRVGKPVAETVLYRVCEDLAGRLGTRQAYLVAEPAAQYRGEGAQARRELTTGQVAAMAGCSPEAVRRAIKSWRLPARMVGRLALVWEKDAQAFARKVRPYRGKRRKQQERQEPVHA